jgi:hypothetical protein
MARVASDVRVVSHIAVNDNEGHAHHRRSNATLAAKIQLAIENRRLSRFATAVLRASSNRTTMAFSTGANICWCFNCAGLRGRANLRSAAGQVTEDGEQCPGHVERAPEDAVEWELIKLLPCAIRLLPFARRMQRSTTAKGTNASLERHDAEGRAGGRL